MEYTQEHFVRDLQKSKLFNEYVEFRIEQYVAEIVPRGAVIQVIKLESFDSQLGHLLHFLIKKGVKSIPYALYEDYPTAARQAIIRAMNAAA